MSEILYNFFSQFENTQQLNSDMDVFINQLRDYSLVPQDDNGQRTQMYIIQSPLVDEKYQNEYNYNDAFVFLSPRHKMVFINFNDNTSDEFEDYYEDFLEDLSSISDRFSYKNIIGRPREWKRDLVKTVNYSEMSESTIKQFLDSIRIIDEQEQRRIELLISLLTGSINDVEKVGLDVPESLLDKVKRKIILFDGNQTNFLYQERQNKRITIQGLSGTGKTELLLHKLKDLYTKSEDTRIFFTCHNLVLADKLKRRIPSFFNFMKVQQQIEWNSRLWCDRAWGSARNKDSGLYRYICYFYNIPFYSFREAPNFDSLCEKTLEKIKADSNNEGKYAFDYIIVDESQDFSENFILLCEHVTKKQVYVAGDIFQNIFRTEDSVQADFLLNQCYRTDPRTLMFAHGLAMGLFEDPILQWLSDEQWEQYGYKIDQKSPQYLLTREPIRRFEDVSSSLESLSLHQIAKDPRIIVDTIIDSIVGIREQHPTVVANDIALIFMTTDRRYMSSIVDLLDYKLIDNGITWDINKAFETKEEVLDSIFATNHNNVKGLEFPFIICISPFELNKNVNQRNALYMALTRSFIHSTLLLPMGDLISAKLNSGLANILHDNVIKVTPPTREALAQITKQLEFDFKQEKSHREIVIGEIKDFLPEISSEDVEWYYEQVYEAISDNFNMLVIKEAVNSLKEYYLVRAKNRC